MNKIMLGYCPLKSMINCTTYVLTVCLRIVKLFSLHINNAANPPLTKATIKPLPARELDAELIGTTGRGVAHVDDVVFRAGRNRRGEGSSGLSAGGLVVLLLVALFKARNQYDAAYGTLKAAPCPWHIL
jgi:hypothetical protein